MAKFYPNHKLARTLGGFEFDWPARTVQDLLDYGSGRYGAPFQEWVGKASILVNGRNIAYLQGNKTPLADTDKVWFVVMHPANIKDEAKGKHPAGH